MKSIIDGKTYNTETATEIGKWWNGCGGGDFNACTETMYRTKNGTLFLHGRGGPMSPYAESREGGRARIGGEKIIPQTETEARAWFEHHDLTDEYVAVFGEPAEA